jgi:heme iron utilization protein
LTHAEQARTLVHGSGRAVLSTVALDPSGYPFGSLVTYLADSFGNPWILISNMAEHTRNAKLDRRASMLVAQESLLGTDPLATARVSLVGDLAPTPPPETMRTEFLHRHPGAQVYVDFPDFSWWRLNVTAIRYVGGFGRMSWVDAADYGAAQPDPIAPHTAGICAHMNADHATAQVKLIQHYLNKPEIISATMTSVDYLGCDFDTVSASGSLPLRLPFPTPVADSTAVRLVLVQMLKGIS